MNRRVMLASALTAGLIAAGCATPTPPNPFKIAEEEFFAKIRTIVLAPVRVPSDLSDSDPVRANFDSLIEAKLREAGFSVVPSREAAEIFDSMNKQLGGIFDPLTGKRDETKVKTAHEHARRELGAKFKADAVLYPSIRVGTASFAGGHARWGGTSESLAVTEGFFGQMQVGQMRGTTGALSLVVGIEEIHGRDLYVNTGGIQLAAKISGGQFIPVPRDQLFTKQDRNVAAVNFALAPLLRNTTPASPPKQP